MYICMWSVLGSKTVLFTINTFFSVFSGETILWWVSFSGGGRRWQKWNNASVTLLSRIVVFICMFCLLSQLANHQYMWKPTKFCLEVGGCVNPAATLWWQDFWGVEYSHQGWVCCRLSVNGSIVWACCLLKHNVLNTDAAYSAGALELVGGSFDGLSNRK